MSRRDLLFERRGEARYHRDLTLMFQPMGGTGRLAETVDISAGGLRFRHLGPGIGKNEKLLVQFTLGRATYSFCGRPVRSAALGGLAREVAVAFVGADSLTRKRLCRSLRFQP